MRKACALVALSLGLLGFVGCGESSQEKAKAQVCAARSDISKQVQMLSQLTLSTDIITQAKAGLEAIGSDVTKIKDVQPNLEPARKQQVAAATSTFATQVASIITGLVSNPSLGNAEEQLRSSLSQYVKSFEQALAPIDCS